MLTGRNKNKKSLLQKIYDTTGLDYNIDEGTNKVVYTKYNIENLYNLEKHRDNCPITLIVYLKKNVSIVDNFFVDQKHVTENIWTPEPNNYTALVMWSPGEKGA